MQPARRPPMVSCRGFSALHRGSLARPQPGRSASRKAPSGVAGRPVDAGPDTLDATASQHAVPDFAAGLQPASAFASKPLAGLRLGLVMETLGEGVAPEINGAISAAAKHLESLGAVVEEVSSCCTCHMYGAHLPTYLPTCMGWPPSMGARALHAEPPYARCVHACPVATACV